MEHAKLWNSDDPSSITVFKRPNMASADLIKYVESHPCCTGTELAKHSGMDPGSCASALGKLAKKKGLITRYLGMASRSKFLNRASADLVVKDCSERRVSMVWRYLANDANVRLDTLVGAHYNKPITSFTDAQRIVLIHNLACHSAGYRAVSGTAYYFGQYANAVHLISKLLSSEEADALRVWQLTIPVYTAEELVDEIHGLTS